MLAILLNFVVNTANAYTLAGRVYICVDAVIVSVVPLLGKRPEKFAFYDLVAKLQRFLRVVQ